MVTPCYENIWIINNWWQIVIFFHQQPAHRSTFKIRQGHRGKCPPSPIQMMPVLYCEIPPTCSVRRPFAVHRNSGSPTLPSIAASRYWTTDVTHTIVGYPGHGAVECVAAGIWPCEWLDPMTGRLWTTDIHAEIWTFYNMMDRAYRFNILVDDRCQPSTSWFYFFSLGRVVRTDIL